MVVVLILALIFWRFRFPFDGFERFFYFAYVPLVLSRRRCEFYFGFHWRFWPGGKLIEQNFVDNEIVVLSFSPDSYNFFTVNFFRLCVGIEFAIFD